LNNMKLYNHPYLHKPPNNIISLFKSGFQNQKSYYAGANNFLTF
jgi:hypothetical protein